MTDTFIPDEVSLPEAQARTTHLGIGAHQDDLEFMAFHGISLCYELEMQWFSGVICTDGGGSPRVGDYADKTDDEMKLVRAQEQRTAAELGKYSFISQLGKTSSSVKDPESRAELIDEIENILLRTQPETIYTHNPADKHPTHVAVCLATLEAILRIPPYSRPKKLYGCEVWRDLDWLNADDKIGLDVSGHPQLAEELNACFQSQIAGGKDYGKAVIGRRRANATFFDSHSTDTVDQLWYALDLTPLIEEDAPSVEDFMESKLSSFSQNVMGQLAQLS